MINKNTWLNQQKNKEKWLTKLEEINKKKKIILLNKYKCLRLKKNIEKREKLYIILV